MHLQGRIVKAATGVAADAQPVTYTAPLRPNPLAGLAVGADQDWAEGRADALAESALARLQRSGARTSRGPVGTPLRIVPPPRTANLIVRRTLKIAKYRGDNPTFIANSKTAMKVWQEHKDAKQYTKLTEADFDTAFRLLDDVKPPATKDYADRDTYFTAMLDQLRAGGADLSVATKVLPTGAPAAANALAAVDAGREVAETATIFRAAMENQKGADTDVVDLTRAELNRLTQTRAVGKNVRYVAAVALAKWQGAEVTTKKAAGGSAAVPSPLTLMNVRAGTTKYKDDKSVDKTADVAPRTPLEQKEMSAKLATWIPTVRAQDPATFAAIEELLNKRLDTENMTKLANEMTTAFMVLDDGWMTLKPKSRDALRLAIGKTKEFGGLRGVIGEVSAAMYSVAMGRTEVGVGNEKLFDPDHRPAGKPKPGVDSQDVDVASNTDTHRFYTEAKYDMGTFLDKASETIKTGPSVGQPAQLDRYKRLASRTKLVKPVKKARELKLEVFIANGHDWLALFDHPHVLQHLRDGQWRVVVETYDVIPDAALIRTRFVLLRDEVFAQHKGSEKISLSKWIEELSSSVTPEAFVTMSEVELQEKSANAWFIANLWG